MDRKGAFGFQTITVSDGNNIEMFVFEDHRAQRVYLKVGAFVMYAVIETGGKQYQVKPGDEVFVEKLDVNAEDAVTFDKVMVVGADDGIKVGAPYVDGASVTAKVIKNGKSKKVTVFTYKPKKGEKTKIGHRQPYTKVMIEAINA